MKTQPKPNPQQGLKTMFKRIVATSVVILSVGLLLFVTVESRWAMAVQDSAPQAAENVDPPGQLWRPPAPAIQDQYTVEVPTFVMNVPAAPQFGSRRNSANSFVQNIKNAKTDEEREKAIATARASLEKEYNRYLESSEKQVQQLEKRLASLREHLEKRSEAKDRLVDLKLELIISQAEGIGWPGENGAPDFPRNLNYNSTAPPNFENPDYRPRMQNPGQAPNQPSRRPRAGSTYRNDGPFADTPPNPGLYNTTPTLPAEIPPLALPSNSVPADIPLPPNGIDSPGSRAPMPGTFDNGNFIKIPNQTLTAYPKLRLDRLIQSLEEKNYRRFLLRHADPNWVEKQLSTRKLGEIESEFSYRFSRLLPWLRNTELETPRQEGDELVWQFHTDEGDFKSLRFINRDGAWYLQIDENDEEASLLFDEERLDSDPEIIPDEDGFDGDDFDDTDDFDIDQKPARPGEQADGV